MRAVTILLSLTIASPALADGAVIKSCDWSAAGPCPFNATKGADYLIDVIKGTDCEATIQLVNPAGQVTKSLSVEQLTDFCGDYSVDVPKGHGILRCDRSPLCPHPILPRRLSTMNTLRSPTSRRHCGLTGRSAPTAALPIASTP